MPDPTSASTQERPPQEPIEERFRSALADRDFYREAAAKYGRHQSRCESVLFLDALNRYEGDEERTRGKGYRDECTCGWTEFRKVHLRGA